MVQREGEVMGYHIRVVEIGLGGREGREIFWRSKHQDLRGWRQSEQTRSQG